MLKVLYTNSNGLFNKLSELKQSIAIYGSDIVCVCETHLNKDILDAEIDIPGFTMFRRDRDFSVTKDVNCVSKGGGSIIYVRNKLSPTHIEWFKAPDSVAIEVDSNIGRVNIVCIYRSVSLRADQNEAILNMLKKLVRHNVESVVVGDLNLPNVSWISGSVNAPLSTNNKVMTVQQQFLDCVHENGLVWFITDEITRRRVVDGNLQESTLDQVFATNDALINDVNIVSPLGKSDHVCFNIELNLVEKNKQNVVSVNKAPRKLWGKVMENEILKRSLDVDWSFSSDKLSSNDMWNELYLKLNLVSDIVPVEKGTKDMPWVKILL